MIELAGAEIIKKGIELAKGIEAVMGKKGLEKAFLQIPKTAQEINQALKEKNFIKDGIKKGAEAVYNHEAKDDPDLQDMGKVLKSIEDVPKNLKDIITQAPKTAQEINQALKGFIKDEIKKGAEAVYDHEAKDDPDLQDMGKVLEKIKVDSENVKETVPQTPETTQPALTQSEKIKQQEQAISEIERGERSLDTTQEKGNYGEMKTDQDLRDKGYERISIDMVTDVTDSGHQGIDGVYHNPDGIPPYMIVDAKYGSAQLSDTMDGKQMSEGWINERLDKAVGKEKADEIRMEKLLHPDNVGSYVSHVDENGKVSYDKLDGNANIIEKDVKINEQREV